MIQLNKIGGPVRDAWLMVGLTLLLFCLLEASLSLAFGIKDRLGQPGSPRSASPVSADAYADPSWVPGYYQEMDALSRSTAAAWKPYVYWRHRPYRGDDINIDPDGIRTTSTAQRQRDSSAPVKIFMFGGSTLWGVGARDAFTIPSILAKTLQTKGIAAEVINYAETGYVSTQEVIALLIELQKGHIPDLVIFYDGVNDIYSAFQQHTAGLPQNEFNRAKEFGVSAPDRLGERCAMILQDAAERLSTVRLLHILLRYSGVVIGVGPVLTPLRESESESLAQGILTKYTGNMELVKALGAHYHFKDLFYWQPSIYQKTHLTKYESRVRDTRHEQFFRQTYDVVRRSGIAEKHESHFHDLSLVFSAVREPIYVDSLNHMGESGNEMIAMRMVGDVLGVLNARNHADPRN